MRQYNTCFGGIFGYIKLYCEKMACPINMSFLGQLELIDLGILQVNLSILVLTFSLPNRITLSKFKIVIWS